MVKKTSQAARKKEAKLNVPDFLVKEEIDGIKFYYKGYQDVLNGTKKTEDITGCGGLQAFIIEYLFDVLSDSAIRMRYRRFTNESGNHFAHRNNMQFDIVLYDKTLLTGDKITRKYVQGIPPSLVVEIDLDVELKDTGIDSVEEFLIFKTQNLFKFGVGNVLWVLTKSKKVLVAQGSDWTIHDWDADLELIDGVKFNIARHLEEEGVDADAA